MQAARATRYESRHGCRDTRAMISAIGSGIEREMTRGHGIRTAKDESFFPSVASRIKNPRVTTHYDHPVVAQLHSWALKPSLAGKALQLCQHYRDLGMRGRVLFEIENIALSVLKRSSPRQLQSQQQDRPARRWEF